MHAPVDSLACEVCRAPAHPAGHLLLVVSDAYEVRTVERVHVVCGFSCACARVSDSFETMPLADLARRDLGDVLDAAVTTFDWSNRTIRRFSDVLQRLHEVRRA